MSHSPPVWALQVWSALPLVSPQTPSLSPHQPGVAPSAPSASKTVGRQADMKLQRLGVALTMNLSWLLHHHGSNHAAVMICCLMDMVLVMMGRASTSVTTTRSESAGSLLDEDAPQKPQVKSLTSSPRGRRHHRRKMPHDAPGFLQLYKKMHHIDREQLLPSDVIRSVRARILELERLQQQHRHNRHGWAPFGNEVPQHMVPNRISEYEQLIQKSKSMPDLGDENAPSGTTTPGSSRASSCPKRRFSVESLLEEEDPPERARNPPEGQPRPGPDSSSLVPIHGKNQRQHQDYSDSEQDACASEMSDIHIEGSSLCSESDLDRCSLTSSESFFGSGQHHHHRGHHYHLPPSSYTRVWVRVKVTNTATSSAPVRVTVRHPIHDSPPC